MVRFNQTREFLQEQRKWYKRLKKEGFYDIESGLDSPPMLKPHHRGLNAVHTHSGRKALPVRSGSSSVQGDEWEQLLSAQDHRADLSDDIKARYMHYAQLLASAAYAQGFGGPFQYASEMRATWALHSLGVSERDIAKALDTTRHFVVENIGKLRQYIERAVAREVEECYTGSEEER